MNPISKSIPKRGHVEKTRGSAVYVCDYPADGLLFGRLLRSSKARARILSVKVPQLPEGYRYIDKKDISGSNHVDILDDNMPVFADETVEFVGDPIGLLAGPDARIVNELLGKIEIRYKELPAVFDAKESQDVFFDYGYAKGDIDKAFAEADEIYDEDFETGRQEHAYLETNGVIAEYKDGKIHVHGSIQCPYDVRRAVAKATGMSPQDISVAQDVIGGGFGGKEDVPSMIACQAAVAAVQTKKSIRLILDRKEDIETTSKRHSSTCKYKAAVKNGEITGMEVEVLYDAGAYTTVSDVVLRRGMLSAAGVYSIPNLKVHGQARKTNTVPSGAFRGFGDPQIFFAVEMMMTHIAGALGKDPVAFKLAHTAKQGDTTPTNGKYHFPVPIPEMVRRVLEASDYSRKREEYKFQSGRLRKGIGMSMVFHGCGYTGSVEQDFIKPVVRLHKDSGGNVEILTAGIEMGQGLHTVFVKIVARALGLAPEKITHALPDTAKVPDSGPTIASRSVMVVGELLRRAAEKLKKEWSDGEEQTVEEHYKHPEFLIPFDTKTLQGDAFPVYSWAVNAVEVEIDTLTGRISVIGAWGSFDVGTPIDEGIVIGQMEGGFLQSIGWGMMEKVTVHSGSIRSNTLSDYMIPTAMDVPNLRVMLHVDEYPFGPYGAKGAGELPHVGGAPATIEAIQNALGMHLNKTPFLAEDVIEALKEVKE